VLLVLVMELSSTFAVQLTYTVECHLQSANIALSGEPDYPVYGARIFDDY